MNLTYSTKNKANDMRVLQMITKLSILLTFCATGCLPCPDYDIPECGLNSTMVLDTDGMCSFSRCETKPECRGIDEYVECEEGTQKFYQINEDGCEVITCTPMMSPESECPTDETPDCDEDEYLTSYVSE